MAIFDFLWNGSPPPSTTTYGTSTTGIPQYLNDYTQGLLAASNSIGGQPYQFYDAAPRIAGFTPDQTAAFNMTRNNVGAWQPTMNAGIASATNAANADPAGAATPWMNRAGGMSGSGASSPYFNAAAGMQGANTASPYMGAAVQQNGAGAASPFMGAAASQNGAGAASPYMNAALSMNGYDAGSPLLNSAASMNPSAPAYALAGGAAGQWPDANVDAYMSPYLDQVVNRVGQLGARNLSENLLPAIGDQFVRAGQSGSSRMQEAVGKAMRDTQESVLAAQGNLLNQGYGAAMGQFNADKSRLAGLAGTVGNIGLGEMRNRADIGNSLGTLANSAANTAAGIGSTMGGLTNSYGNLLSGIGTSLGGLTNNYGNMLSNIGSTMGGLTNTSANTMAGMGSSAGSIANNEQGNLANMGQTMGNLTSMGAKNDIDAGTALSNMANNTQGMNLRDAAAMEGIGATRQGQDQRSLDLAYQNFLDERDWAKNNATFMSAMLRGLPYGTTTNTSATGPASSYSPSPLSQLAGAYSLYSALNRARGGYVNGYADGGPIITRDGWFGEPNPERSPVDTLRGRSYMGERARETLHETNYPEDAVEGPLAKRAREETPQEGVKRQIRTKARENAYAEGGAVDWEDELEGAAENVMRRRKKDRF